jgi:hypothetical protein
MGVLKRSALLWLLLPLLGVSGAPGPFVHAFSAGDSLRYTYTLEIDASSEHRSFHGDLRLQVKAVEPAVSGTEIRTSVAPAQRSVRDFRIGQDGTLAFTGGKSDSHNYFTYDPRQYCALPAVPAVGTTWNCTSTSLGMYAGGASRVRLTQLDGASATLEIDGSATGAPRAEHDPDNGKTYMSRSTTSWHELVHFRDGIVSSSMREQRIRTVIQNLTTETTLTVRMERS